MGWGGSLLNPYSVLLGQCFGSNWALVSEPGFFRFSSFQIFDSRDFYVRKIFLGNLVVRYRGNNNKGVLDRLWTK